MKSKLNQGNEKGFTIIEVLIVLAIAGLILLIVFLAVPALQRNSRNTQRKNDVSAVLGSVSEYASNNGGKLPTTKANVTDITNLGFYDEATEVSLVKASGNVSNTNNSNMVIATNAVCVDGANDYATSTGASSRNVVVLYRAEVGSGGAFQTVCQAS